MKRATTLLAAAIVVFATNATFAQDEPGPGFEHLKVYGPLIGTWRYEGPLLEDVNNVDDEGAEVVIQISWRRILNKSAVEYNWTIQLKEGGEISGKTLVGWNANKKEITLGAMDSLGGMGMGTATFDDAGKTETWTVKGTDAEGNETYSKGVITKTGKDTLTWQALEREGGLAEGPSPVYTFKRVKRERKKKQS